MNRTRIQRVIAALLIALPLATNAGTPRLHADFSQPGDWAKQTDSVKFTVADGVLRGESVAEMQPTTYAPVSVSPAAGWRAQVDVTFRAFDDSVRRRAGIVAYGPLNDRLYFGLTATGFAYVEYFDGKEWAKVDPLPQADATAAKPGLNATNRLSVQREAGYFTVYVNGAYVGRTRIIDFTPRWIGVFQVSGAAMTVEYDNLVVDEVGVDTRYARLLNLEATPGAPELLVETFDRKPKKGEGWFLGKNDSISAEIRDGRYLLTGLTEQSSTWVAGNPYSLKQTEIGGGIEINRPVHLSAYQASARFTEVKGNPDFGKGLAIIGAAPKDAPYSPYVALQYANGGIRAFFDPGVPDGVVDLLPWTDTPSLNANGDNRLNITVMPDGRALLFVNGDYQTTVRIPRGFRMDSLGAMVDGPQIVAVDDYYAREL